MSFNEVSSILAGVFFCLYIVIEYYRGKKVEKISKNLTEEETKKLRKELLSQRDLSGLATIKLPKVFEYIGNILAILVILFFLALFALVFLKS